MTPTGAALLSEFATFERPADDASRRWATALAPRSSSGPTRCACGWANDDRIATGVSDSASDSVVELACNLDDTTGETLGYVMQALLEAGALDVWFTPIQMKKNRPATKLSVLARPEDADRLAALVLRETPTLGVRQADPFPHKSRAGDP